MLESGDLLSSFLGIQYFCLASMVGPERSFFDIELGGRMTNSHTGNLADQLGILLDAMETCTHDKHLTLALSRFTRAIGLKRFGFVCTDGDRVITVTDLPTSWEERYHAERYARVDPVVSRARRSHGPFEWSLPKL